MRKFRKWGNSHGDASFTWCQSLSLSAHICFFGFRSQKAFGVRLECLATGHTDLVKSKGVRMLSHARELAYQLLFSACMRPASKRMLPHPVLIENKTSSYNERV